MLSVDRKALLAALETLKTVTPGKGSMPVLNNVSIVAQSGSIRLSATDLYRAAWVTLPGDGAGTWSRAVDLRMALDRAKRFRNGHCTLGADGLTNLTLTEGPRAFTVRGSKPEDMPPLPPEDKARHVVTMPCASLAAAMDRVLYAVSQASMRTVTVDRALFAEVVGAIGPCANKSTGELRLRLSDDTLTVEARDADSEAKETMPVARTGARGDFAVGINFAYLRDLLDVVTGDTVAIETSGELDPIVVREKGGVNVIMPMRIR